MRYEFESDPVTNPAAEKELFAKRSEGEWQLVTVTDYRYYWQKKWRAPKKAEADSGTD